MDSINLDTKLDQIRGVTLEMASWVETRLLIAKNVVHGNDFSSLSDIRHGDKIVDNFELLIEKLCTDVLLLQQPVASDMRYVVCILRVIRDLERIGDLIKSISKRVEHLSENGLKVFPEPVATVALYAFEQHSKATQALTELDAVLAREVWGSEREVDRLEKKMTALVLKFEWPQSDPDEVASTTHDLLSVIKMFERISHLSCNICEDVVYAVEGTVVRHTRP
ncbi:MAG: phosphate transport system regulatory protein PhoU [Phycisphaerae bacterium]|nr:phosphate transport system regulatory protein PhoU [Phycisphaerae bacterium]